MAPIRRIARFVIFSISATLVSLAVLARLSGHAVSLPFWIFAVLAPGVISTIVATMLDRQSERLRLVHAELSQAHAALKRIAEWDQLTGTRNRTSFLARIEELRAEPGAWLLVLDIDHFKAVNDSYGHEVGDHALQRVAGVLRSSVRAGDIIGRLGGEEFAIYLPRATLPIAQRIAERIRLEVALASVESPSGARVAVTVSIGVAAYDCAAETRTSLRRADVALYEAKNRGRNMVRLAA